MNRRSGLARWGRASVPHVRGDEPVMEPVLRKLDRVFPTCAGMNRLAVPLAIFGLRGAQHPVFLTCVGINGRTCAPLSARPCVPQEREDETRKSLLMCPSRLR